MYKDLREEGDIPKATSYANGYWSRVVWYQYEVEPPLLQEARDVFVTFQKTLFFSAFFGVEELDLYARTS